jgi:SARP family transcriptional regulator, regulator of embCAB operon
VRPRVKTTAGLSDSAGGLRIAMLGGFRLMFLDRLVPLPFGDERLIAFLALRGGPLPRPYVAGTLWPEKSEERASASLRTSLWHIRRMGYPLLDTTRAGICIGSTVTVDFHELVSVLCRIRDSVFDWPGGSLDSIASPAELLPGWYEDWVVDERNRLQQLRLHALETGCGRLIEAGQPEAAVEVGLAAVRDDPLRESARRVLIRAYVAEGNPAEAVRVYRDYRRMLKTEFDLEPSPHIQRVVETLLR